MQVVLLAAGKGERLFPLTKHVPKVLLTVNGIPLISHVINSLPAYITEVIVVVQHQKEKVIDYVNSTFSSRKISWVIQPETSHGTMAAIYAASGKIKGNFLAICADNLYARDSIENLSQVVNTYLAMRVTTEIKNRLYPDAKLSIFNEEDNLFILDAGAWHLPYEFIFTPPVFVKAEAGLPHTFKSYTQQKNVVISPVYTDWWFPVGTFKEIEILHSLLAYEVK